MALVTVVAVVAVLAAVAIAAVVALVAVGTGVAGAAALGALSAFAGIGFAAALMLFGAALAVGALGAHRFARGARGACRAARGHVLGGCLLVGAGCFGGSLHGFGGFCGFEGLLLIGCVLRGGRLSGDGRGGDLLVRTARTAPCRRAGYRLGGLSGLGGLRLGCGGLGLGRSLLRLFRLRRGNGLRGRFGLCGGICLCSRGGFDLLSGRGLLTRTARTALRRRFRGAIGPIDRSVGCGV